jgi:hypothetical protein
MVIDIQRTVIKTQLRRFITLVVFTLGAIIIMLGGRLGHDFLGLNKYHWALITVAVYALVAIAESFLELNYIYFSNIGDQIVLRYFSMSFFNKKKNSIEIPRDRFSGYIFKESLGGLKKKIILIQRVKDLDAKYPPVSISALKKDDIKKLLLVLDNYKT